MVNFYVNLIPVGDSNWRENIYNNIALTTKYYDTEEYFTFDEWLRREDKDKLRKLFRAYEQSQLEDIYSDEPKFFPNEPIMIDKVCLFRMVINYNITRDIDKLNEVVISLWHDELYMPRKDVMWVSVDKTVSNPTNYNLIICNDVELYKEEIDRVIEVCNKYDKPYRVISDNKITFNDVWNMFKVG